MADFLVLIYIGLGAFVAYLLWGQFKFVKIYCKWFTVTRILVFLVATVMLVLTLLSPNLLEIIRNLSCVIVCFLFALINDGISDLGVSSNGTHITWKEVTAYDLHKDNKSYNLLITFNMIDRKGNVNSGNVTLKFTHKQEEAVKNLVESKIKKKYRRMK